MEGVLPMEAEEKWCGCDTELYVGGYIPWHASPEMNGRFPSQPKISQNNHPLSANMNLVKTHVLIYFVKVGPF
jgi:hypothetical protein